MELQDTAASRITIGLPLGLAILFACILFMSFFFCCWLHWNKLKYLFFPSSGAPQFYTQTDLTSSPHKQAFPLVMMKQNFAESLPVQMPGDEVPKFIAIACPCQPPRDERITIQIDKAESQLKSLRSNNELITETTESG